VSFDDSLAFMTGLRSVGMQDEVAARFFGAFTSTLRTATSLKDAQQEGFKSLGLTAAAVEKGMKANPRKTMLDFLERLGKSADKAKIAIQILGKEWWDELARMAQAYPEISRLIGILDSGAHKGSLLRNLQNDLATTDNHLKRTGVLISEIADRLGRWALPPLNEALDSFTQRLDRIDDRLRRSATAEAIIGKGVNDPLTSEEATRVAADPGLRARIALRRAAERRELDAARAKRERLAVEVSSAREAGSGRITNIPAMVAELRKLDAQIAYLERRLETVKAKAVEAPKEKKEGLRGAFGAPVQKIVDDYKAKLLALDATMKTLQLFPNSEEARQKAQKLVDELTAVFQRADLTPEARKVIDSYAAGIGAQGGKVDAAAQAIRARLQQILGAPIVVKIEPRLSGARGVRGSTGAGGATSGGGAGGTTPGKQSSRRGDVHIREAHFHGVRDMASLHRTVMAAADRRARAARDNALHDIDVG
jgi:hypothetical protein